MKKETAINPSRVYLRTLTVEERIKLAKKVKKTSTYLLHIGSHFRTPGRELSVRLEFVTEGKFKSSDFDDEIKATLRMNKAS